MCSPGQSVVHLGLQEGSSAKCLMWPQLITLNWRSYAPIILSMIIPCGLLEGWLRGIRMGASWCGTSPRGCQ